MLQRISGLFMRILKGQQLLLGLQPAAEAGQGAAAANYPVAGQDNGQGISAAGAAHCPAGPGTSDAADGIKPVEKGKSL